MGLLENMANSVVPPPAVYKGYISPDLTCDATKPSRFARRSAINTLKTLGKIPFGYDPGPLQESKPKKLEQREDDHNKNKYLKIYLYLNSTLLSN